MTETSFSPGSGLLGGCLIGLASAALLLLSGRIAGISGILGHCAEAGRGDRIWRLAFLIGLPLGAMAVFAVGGEQSFVISSNPALLIGAGVLVGLGTQLGSGCTSGHGVCGLGRGSPRSLVATLSFMAAAAVTVFVVRHWIGWTP